MIVHIPYKNQGEVWWNELTARIVERFGLPGDRYESTVAWNWMEFKFKSEKDAVFCKIMVSEYLD